MTHAAAAATQSWICSFGAVALLRLVALLWSRGVERVEHSRRRQDSFQRSGAGSARDRRGLKERMKKWERAH